MIAVQNISSFVSEVFDYREYLWQSVARDLRTKYKRSFLGYIWTMLHPLGMMAILAVVFSHIMRLPIEAYAVFVFCGLLPWNYFQSTVLMSLGAIRRNAKLFEQVPVPKHLFILSIACSNLVNLLLALIPLLLIMVLLGRPITTAVFLFPVVLIPIILLTTGLALLLSAASVFFDDTLHLTEVALQGLYFLCPVLYGREFLPEKLSTLLAINPLFTQIEFFRQIFYHGTFPDSAFFFLNVMISTLIFLLCLAIFRRCEDKFLYFV